MLIRYVFAGSDGPQVKGSDRTERGIKLLESHKAFFIQFFPVVEECQSFPNPEISPAENIRTLERKNHQHFSSPGTDSGHGCEGTQEFCIIHEKEGFPCNGFFGEGSGDAMDEGGFAK